MQQKNWETTVCCFSREVVEHKLSVCHSISWTPLSCADFPVLLWDYPVALLPFFYFCPLNQRLQDLPPSIMVTVCQANLTSSTCQSGFCWSKREGNNQRRRPHSCCRSENSTHPNTPSLYFPRPSPSRSEISWKVGGHDLWRSLSSSVDMSELQLGIMRGCSLLRRAGQDVSLTPTASHLVTRFCLILCVCSPHELPKSIFNKHSCLEVAI